MKETQRNLLKVAIQAAKAGGKIIQKREGKGKIVTWKSRVDYAADVDYKSEEEIIKVIKKAYPKHNILTEEKGKIYKKSAYTWVIDPLDGTLNFMHGIPHYAVSIAVVEGDRDILAGVIYAPSLGEMYYASKGKGAFLNGKRIHVGKESDINKALYAGSAHDFEGVKLPHEVLRSFACSSIEMAYLACGRLGGRIRIHEHQEKYKYDPFGYAAGVLIVQEAGGRVTDIYGNPWTLKMETVLASNKKLHKKMLRIFKK